MIAITGANGLLGSFIIRALIDSNQKFIALGRKESNTTLLADVATNVVWRHADVLDPVSLEESLHGVSHVIHAAGLVSFNPRDSKKIYAVNVQGTRNVLHACMANDIKRFLHVSSVAALGRKKDQLVIDEHSKWVSSELNSTYARSKYLAELEIFRAQEEGLSTVVINPSVILAPANWHRSSAQLFKYSWQQKPFYMDGSLNYVDVRDVADIALKLVYSSIQNERFIINAGNINYLDFFKNIAKRFNKKPPSVKLHKKILNLVASAEMVRARLFNTSPLITPETARLAGTYFAYDNQKIKKILNKEFQSIDDTLQWCCDYYLTKINEKN